MVVEVQFQRRQVRNNAVPFFCTFLINDEHMFVNMCMIGYDYAWKVAQHNAPGRCRCLSFGMGCPGPWIMMDTQRQCWTSVLKHRRYGAIHGLRA